MTPDAVEEHSGQEPGPIAGIARSPVSEPFWKALSEGRLEIPFCVQCGFPHFYPRKWCPKCWSEDLSWREVEGVGNIWGMTTVHLAFQGVPDSDIPYTAIFVDLDAGIRMPGRLSPQSGAAAVGTRVRLMFADDPARDLPTFAAADD